MLLVFIKVTAGVGGTRTPILGQGVVEQQEWGSDSDVLSNVNDQQWGKLKLRNNWRSKC